MKSVLKFVLIEVMLEKFAKLFSSNYTYESVNCQHLFLINPTVVPCQMIHIFPANNLSEKNPTDMSVLPAVCDYCSKAKPVYLRSQKNKILKISPKKTPKKLIFVQKK